MKRVNLPAIKAVLRRRASAKTSTKTSTKKRRGSRPSPRPRSLPARLARLAVIVAAVAVTVVFLVWLADLTLTPRPGATDQIHNNTQPGSSLRQYLDRPSVRAAILQVGGNLLLFAPLGVLLPIIFRQLRGPLRIALVVGLVSLTVESVQAIVVLGRAFDIDDVLLNTAGAVIAYLVIGWPITRWLRRRT